MIRTLTLALALLTLPFAASAQQSQIFEIPIQKLQGSGVENVKLITIFDGVEYEKCNTWDRSKRLCTNMRESSNYVRYDYNRRGDVVKVRRMTGRQIRYTGLGSIAKFSYQLAAIDGYPYVSLTKRDSGDVICATWVNAGICSGLRRSELFTLHYYTGKWRDYPVNVSGKLLQRTRQCFRACL